VAELDLSQCGPSLKQRFQIVNAIADALDRGVAVETVAEHALHKASEAKTVKYFVRAFSPEYLPTTTARASPAATSLPPPCGQCDGRPNEPISTRVVWLDADKAQSEPCPRCHPQALSA
jgi:hypothetical protein